MSQAAVRAGSGQRLWGHWNERIGVWHEEKPQGDGVRAARLVLPQLVKAGLPHRAHGAHQRVHQHAGRARHRLVRRENISALPASDWSVVRIYLRVFSAGGKDRALTLRSHYAHAPVSTTPLPRRRLPAHRAALAERASVSAPPIYGPERPLWLRGVPRR
eukprot:1177108-Prorocentrum_minimum.AAC.2